MIQEKQNRAAFVVAVAALYAGSSLRGNWVVREQKGARGGLFVDREAALPSSAQKPEDSRRLS